MEKKYSRTTEISVANVDDWLLQFENINEVNFKVKVKKKQTKQYAIQHYYRCQHNTRVSSLHKDPQRRLEINPTARVKNTHCPYQLVIKIDMSGVCSINIDWKHNRSTENLEASNFKTLSQKSVEKITKLYEAGHTIARHHGYIWKPTKETFV